MSLTVSHRPVGAETAVAELNGRPDEFDGLMLRERLRDATVDRRHLVLEVGRLECLDATSLGALVYAYKRVLRKDGSLRIVGATARVENLLRVTGLRSLLPSAPSLAAALEEIRAAADGDRGGESPS